MDTVTAFELYMERIESRRSIDAGRRSGELAATPDILSLGMLADTLRRRLHGTRVTFLRVADVAFEPCGCERASSSARSSAHWIAGGP